MIENIDIKKLSDEGWVLRNSVNVDKNELIRISKVLGKPVPSRVSGNFVDELIPLEKDLANPNSLSALYGAGAFPFHTDTAYWRNPARYLILYAKNPGENRRPTQLLDVLSVIKNVEIYKSAVIKVVNGRNSFLCNIVEETASGSKRIRLDQGCMVPATKSSSLIFKDFIRFVQNQKPITINWSQGDLLIIDNWRLLHARSDSTITDKDRLLYRVTIL